MNGIFKQTGDPNTNIITPILIIKKPLRKTNHRQKALSDLASNIFF